MSQPAVSHGSTKTYVSGFLLSIVLTLAAYLCTTHNIASGWALMGILAVLAVIQLFVQLVFFLHLGRGSESRWNTTVLLFAAMVVGILVFGSLWIMGNLSYGHQNIPTTQQIIKDEGYQP